MRHSSGRRGLAAIAGVMVWLLLVAPAASAGDPPPDQVDPPAEGEGEPLDDPSDPPPPEYSTSAYPSPSVSLSGRQWTQPTVDRFGGPDRFRRGVKASRQGWPDGAPAAVLVSGSRLFDGLGAATLAAAVDGPLLLTRHDRLLPAVADELERLDVRRVFVVGVLDVAVERKVRRLGLRAVRVGGTNRFLTSRAVAQLAVELGADAGSVIVASGEHLAENGAVAALAAGTTHPVLLSRRASKGPRLQRWVADLGARRTFVVGSTRVIGRGVVAELPNVQRLAGATPVSTAAAVARRALKLGLRGRPAVADVSARADVLTLGTLAGSQRNAPLLLTDGPQLAPRAVDWLAERNAHHVLVLTPRLSDIAACQIAQGRTRSWYCAERTLKRQGYDIRTVDGRTDAFSVWAIYAFEKVAGFSANGSFGEAEWERMLDNPRRPVRRKDLPDTHVEIDLGRQLILLVEDGKVAHHLHTSTGKASTPTVRGTFTVYEKRNYRQANHMYRAIFFYGGYAIHGYPSIPTYPASHGCSRTYDGNQDFLYPKVFIGERVATY